MLLTAIIILDHGRDLDEGPIGPWLNPSYVHSKFDSLFRPIIQFPPRDWPLDRDTDTVEPKTSIGLAATQRPYAQSASLLPSKQYGQYLSPELMKTDPFYALHGVFTFSASSESQFLNALQTKAEEWAERRKDEDSLQRFLEDYQYHKKIIRRKLRHFLDTEELIQSRKDLNWPMIKVLSESMLGPIFTSPISEDSPSRGRFGSTISIQKERSIPSSAQADANAAAELLLRDFKELTRRAGALLNFYSEEIDDMRTSTALLEARKNTVKASEMTRLSLLAFFFLPLSFTTGFYGMNFRELGDHLSIWTWVVTSIPLFLGALLLYFWTHVFGLLKKSFKLCIACWRRLRIRLSPKSAKIQAMKEA